MENMAVVAMNSKDIKRASVIVSRIGDPFVTGILVAQVAELMNSL